MWTANIQISLGISVICGQATLRQQSHQRRCNVMTLHRRWCEVVWTPCARRGGVPSVGGGGGAWGVGAWGGEPSMPACKIFFNRVHLKKEITSDLKFKVRKKKKKKKKKKNTENLSCFIIYVEKKETEWKNKKRKEKKKITSNFKVKGLSSVSYFFSLSVDVFASLGISFLLAALSWNCFLCVTNSSWKFIDTTALL